MRRDDRGAGEFLRSLMEVCRRWGSKKILTRVLLTWILEVGGTSAVVLIAVGVLDVLRLPLLLFLLYIFVLWMTTNNDIHIKVNPTLLLWYIIS